MALYLSLLWAAGAHHPLVYSQHPASFSRVMVLEGVGTTGCPAMERKCGMLLLSGNSSVTAEDEAIDRCSTKAVCSGALGALSQQ